MQRAIASGDTDLIYLVLLYSERFYAKEENEFHKVVLSHPESYQLLASYYQKRGSTDKLHHLYEKKRAHFAMGALIVADGSEKDKMKDRIDCLTIAAEMFQGNKDLLFQAKMTEEHVMLLKEQEKLNRELVSIMGDLRDMSLMDTIFDLCAAGISDSRCLEYANNLYRKFKPPEKLFYHTKARALAQSKFFEELFRFSNERKPPIGYAPFAKYCLDMNNEGEAKRYVDRIVDLDEKFQVRKLRAHVKRDSCLPFRLHFITIHPSPSPHAEDFTVSRSLRARCRASGPRSPPIMSSRRAAAARGT